MADQNPYPPQPEDLELARFIDRYRDQDIDQDVGRISARDTHQTMDKADPESGPAGPGEDPLLPFLEAYRAQARLRTHASADESLWETIKASLPHQSDGGKVFTGVEEKAYGRPQPWRRPGSEERSRTRETLNRWMPFLGRAAALLALTLLIWIMLSRQGAYEPDLMAEASTEMLQLALPDGSQVTLRPYSSLYRLVETAEEQGYEIRGEGFFNVKHNAGRTFRVQTADALVTVSGTRFSVRTWEDGTRVYLDQGRVTMEHVDGFGTVALSPGESGRINDGKVVTSTQIPGEAHLGWLENELVLDRRPLSMIAREVSHHFNISVAVAPGLEEMELSGTLVLDDPERVLEDLAVSSGGVVENPVPDRYLIMEPESNR